MESLTQLEIIIMLLGVMLALTTLSRRLLIPYPILLVIGGLVHSLIPGLPTVRLNSDLIFLVFLPPILWAAAYFTSLREFRANLRPISMLAVGVVLATTAAVAAIAHWLLPGLSWAAAIVLGAIVSPPDAVAATAIARRLGIPRRLVTILEGGKLSQRCDGARAVPDGDRSRRDRNLCLERHASAVSLYRDRHPPRLDRGSRHAQGTPHDRGQLRGKRADVIGALCRMGTGGDRACLRSPRL